jgi:hypothetical protein
MLYYMTQQPATVNPNEVLLSSGSGNATQNYPSSYPTADPSMLHPFLVETETS